MEAPDKIYVSRPIYNQCGLVISEDKPVEYLRKDTLMKWLEGKKKHYMDRQEYDCGWNDLLDDIIDKLNSL